MKLETINNAKIAVQDYADRKAAAIEDIRSLLRIWYDIQSDSPDFIVVTVLTKGDTYYQLEDSDKLWRTQGEYDRQNSTEVDLKSQTLATLLKILQGIERAIAMLPARLADNTLRYYAAH